MPRFSPSKAVLVNEDRPGPPRHDSERSAQLQLCIPNHTSAHPPVTGRSLFEELTVWSDTAAAACSEIRAGTPGGVPESEIEEADHAVQLALRQDLSLAVHVGSWRVLPSGSLAVRMADAPGAIERWMDTRSRICCKHGFTGSQVKHAKHVMKCPMLHNSPARVARRLTPGWHRERRDRRAVRVFLQRDCAVAASNPCCRRCHRCTLSNWLSKVPASCFNQTTRGCGAFQAQRSSLTRVVYRAANTGFRGLPLGAVAPRGVGVPGYEHAKLDAVSK